MQTRRRPAVMQRGGTQRQHRPDYVLLVLCAMLLVIGLVTIYSISPGLAVQRGVEENYYATKQMIAIGLGLITFTAMALIPYTVWQRFIKPLLVIAGIATIVALLTPVTPEYPAPRWIRFAGLSFQSVELLKIALIFLAATFFARQIQNNNVNDIRLTVKPVLIAAAITAGVVAVLQSDLGSMIVIAGIVFAMWFVCGISPKNIALLVAIGALALFMLIGTSDYRRDRFATFMNPQADCQSTGYQACQAMIAVGTGGLFGKGLGHSVQAYGYLPEPANDSIFAVIAEKFGFVGVSILLVIFGAFFTRLKMISERAPDMFSRLVVIGVLAWFSVQAVVNIGAMIGLLPLKGITLPFVSYGGTSIVFVTAALGLVYNISRFTSMAPNELANVQPRTTRRESAYAYSVRR